MHYVSTGFQLIDAMLSGGLPRGGLTFIAGGTGEGKTILLRKIARNVCAKGLKVVYFDVERVVNSEEYPVKACKTIGELHKQLSDLLKFHLRSQRPDLVIMEGMQQLEVDIQDNPRKLLIPGLTKVLHRNDFGSTAVIASWQLRRSIPTFTQPSFAVPNDLASIAHVTLGIVKEDHYFRVHLSKSRVSHSGVSCSVPLEDLLPRIDIPTRYERIERMLNGRD